MLRRAPFLAAAAAAAAVAIFAASAASAQPAQVRATAVRRTGPLQIDGRLDEPAWAAAPKQGRFTQRFPRDAAAPSADTRFAILFDDEAIYVGVWADDPEPERVRALLTRRDTESAADAVTIAFDSYHDRRTAYAFELNAGGVQRDFLWFDDTNQDDTWDAVWTGDAAQTPSGWTAELRIPLSQLRFSAAEVQEWGLQVVRTVGRTGEQSAWSPWPRSTPQVVSRFGTLGGVRGVGDGLRLELLPYVALGGSQTPVAPDDHVNRQYDWRRGLGLDAKYGLGPAFTLSLTINPDFGQVEADPSQINLTASELFLVEKRPFFLEGGDLFKMPLGTNGTGNEGMIYTRRIGETPAAPSIAYTYARLPSSTTIYGAVKLTGKTGTGWSVGVLDAVTGPETATVVPANGDGSAQDVDVAPLTNYAIVRLKRDLYDGQTSIGVSATAVHRELSDSTLADSLHDQAYTVGAQLQHRSEDAAWLANVMLLGSYVHGSPTAIAVTQRDAVHNFQRPDAMGLRFDPTRTSLSGLAATWQLGQLGDVPHWRYGVGGVLRTAGFDTNDAGYLLRSDHLVPYAQLEYRETTPTAAVLNWDVEADAYWVQTLEPRLESYGIESSDTVQLANYWTISAYVRYDHGRWDLRALRGGPALRLDSRLTTSLDVATDPRAPVQAELTATSERDLTSGGQRVELSAGVTVQARDNLTLFAGPDVVLREDPLQYVDAATDELDPDRTHYVLGRIHQTVTSLTVRVNWTISPHLAIQAYAQPYLAALRYDELKDVERPAADRYADRFTLLDSALSTVDGGYVVSTPDARYRFARPDRNVRELHSTLVARWEYRPGSTVFAIWSHGQTTNQLTGGELALGRDLRTLVNAGSEDIVMIKVNYWIGL